MIISDKHKFAFIHIPKCAGSSVRSELAQYDDMRGRFYVEGKLRVHPVLGPLDYNHITLRVLRSYFEDIYKRLQGYRVFAVCRDPYERFPSSLAQRLMMYRGATIQNLSGNEIRFEIDQVIDYLSKEESILDPEFIHFEKQINYVEIDGKKIVNHLYCIEEIDCIAQAVGEIVGADLYFSRRVGENRYYRSPQIELIINGLKPGLSTILPKQVYKGLKKVAERKFKARYADAPHEIFKSSIVLDFVSTYYAQDIELYEGNKTKSPTNTHALLQN